MKCIYCTKAKTDVVNSREIQKGTATWRRRKCSACKRVFTTIENGYAQNLFVLKLNGKRQRFSYEKLFASIFSILSHTKNRDNGNNALLSKKIFESILPALIAVANDRTLSSSDIIAHVYTALKKIDHAFAEYYIFYSEHRRKVGTMKGFI